MVRHQAIYASALDVCPPPGVSQLFAHKRTTRLRCLTVVHAYMHTYTHIICLYVCRGVLYPLTYVQKQQVFVLRKQASLVVILKRRTRHFQKVVLQP